MTAPQPREDDALPSAAGPRPAGPAPVVVTTRWPAPRQAVADGTRFGAALGAVVGVATLGQQGWPFLFIGAALGAGLGFLLGSRRHTLRLDAGGLTIGRLSRVDHVPWPEVRAVGLRQDWHGRSGRVVGLCVCRVGVLLPIPVPALTYTASGFRMGREHPADRLEAYIPDCLEPVRAWAAAMGVPVVGDDIDRWWDGHPDAGD